MTIWRNNKTRLKTVALTDENDDPITDGTVTAAVLGLDRTTEYFEDAAASHTAGGVWQRILDAADIEANIPADVRRAWVRFTIGDPVSAEFWRLEHVRYRES